jgi:hypothetical protein
MQKIKIYSLQYYLQWKIIKHSLPYIWYLSKYHYNNRGADLFSKDLNGCGLAHFAAFNDNVFILKFLKNLFKFNIFE